jgi:8-oxo-dGTP diphosphatase
MNMDNAVMIGVAVVEAFERYLVGKRSEDRTLPGKAEFPGGKCEADESPMSCAIRECKEETGLDVEPVLLMAERRFEYEHATVDLRFWLCKPKGDVDPHADLNGFRWLTVEELLQEDFPEANEPILEKIRYEGPFFKTGIAER